MQNVVQQNINSFLDFLVAVGLGLTGLFVLLVVFPFIIITINFLVEFLWGFLKETFKDIRKGFSKHVREDKEPLCSQEERT